MDDGRNSSRDQGPADGALDGSELLPLVYGELRRLAHARVGREPAGGAGQTLQPTALVHEAYLRLMGSGPAQWNSPGHFFGAAACAMRRILVERARERGQIKRGGGRDRLPLSHAEAGEDDDPVDLLGLDEALGALEQEDPRKSQVVMLRYFAGLSLEQTAEALGASLATVKRDWAYARAWLFERMNPEPDAPGGTADANPATPSAGDR